MNRATNPAGKVDSRTEAVVGVLLGASSEDAATVVELLIQAGLLRHGTATIATAAASRWGVEVADALHALGQGRSLGATFSDYELRVAQEEAQVELADALQQTRDGPRQRISTERNKLEAVGPTPAVVPASPHHVDLRDVME